MKSLAVVTGGTRGIGKSITEGLVRLGFDVYFTYKSREDLALGIERLHPGSCKAFKFDHENDDTNNFACRILAERTPDILINNIGMNHDELFLNQDLSSFWKIIQFNFGSTVACCKMFLESMIQKRKGHIINISSVAAIKPKVGNTAYGVSKAAIERFSKSLALEVARFNIRVNCVSPAYVKTDLLNAFLDGKKEREFYKAIPMRKVLLPEEVANIVVLLCSDQIRTTGSVFYVGNGENIVN